jgi:drug/metabolite transporter (DMT)-like permease
LPDHRNTHAAADLPKQTTPAAFLAMLLANVALAFGPTLVRMAQVSPIGSGFWRLALAAPVLLLLTVGTRQPIPRMPRKLWAWLLVGGIFFAADLAAWHIGIVRTKLANAALFANLTTFTFAAYGLIIARSLPTRSQVVALVLAAIGTIVLIGRSYELSPQYLIGDLLCITAGLFYTGYLIAIEKVRGVLAPLPALAISTLTGLVPLWLFAWGAGQEIWPRSWGPLVLLALGSQVIGQGLLVYAVGRLPPLVVGMGFLIQPLMGAVLGSTLYGEQLGPADMIGGMAVAAALVLARRGSAAPLANRSARD